MNKELIKRIRTSRTVRVCAITAAAVVGSGVLWYLLFAFTSLNRLLPVRLNSSMRDSYTSLAARVDSMTKASQLNSQYARNIAMLLADSVSLDSTEMEADTIVSPLPIDSLMEASAAEKLLVERYEASERFNLSVLSPIAAEGMVFFPPVPQTELKATKGAADMPTAAVEVPSSTPVSSIYYGTVIDVYFIADKGITVAVQHPNGFISQYGGLRDVFVAKGAKVNTGQRIGMASGAKHPLSFMMWHNGTALDPADYINAPTPPAPSSSQPFVKDPYTRRR